jgi:hypothetical protein
MVDSSSMPQFGFVFLFKDTQALSDLVKTVDGLKYSVQASSILDSHDVADQPAAVSNATILAKVSATLMVPHWYFRSRAAVIFIYDLFSLLICYSFH